MGYRKANKFSNIFSLAGIAVVVLLYFFNEVNALFIITAVVAIALIIAGLIVKLKFYRCPHCHSGLPLRTIALPEYCSYCGKRLDS